MATVGALGYANGLMGRALVVQLDFASLQVPLSNITVGQAQIKRVSITRLTVVTDCDFISKTALAIDLGRTLDTSTC